MEFCDDFIDVEFIKNLFPPFYLYLPSNEDFLSNKPISVWVSIFFFWCLSEYYYY